MHFGENDKTKDPLSFKNSIGSCIFTGTPTGTLDLPRFVIIALVIAAQNTDYEFVRSKISQTVQAY